MTRQPLHNNGMRIDTKVDQNKKHLHYMRDTEKTIVTDRLLRHRDIHTITYLPSDRHIHTTTHTLTHSHTDTHTHTHTHTHHLGIRSLKNV